jgi:predicted hydrocarbon binding protein/CRISPR/Cas system CSM-associated protein Csm2 small subunit
MPVKDRVVNWFIKNIIIPKREIIDKPGFIVNTFGGKNQPIFLREFFLSEHLLELIENRIVEKYGDEGRHVLYSAGKKFGYIYASMSNFPTIKETKKKEFLDFAYFLVRYIETLFATDVQHEINLEDKVFTMNIKDYIICRNNGLGYIMTDGGTAGIWSYALSDKTIEGMQVKCQGRGNNKCQLICAPEKKLKELNNKFFTEINLQDKKMDNVYKKLNEIRTTTYSTNSLRDLINANFFQYKGGVLSYKKNRFFACDSHLLYILEDEIAKLENGEKILFDVCFEYGKFVRELYSGKNYKKFITDYYPALGFGDINISDSNDIKVASVFYPWTIFSEKSRYIIFRGIMSGFISDSIGERIDFKNFDLKISNYLTLTIRV